VTPCIWLGTTHTCNAPHYDLWLNLYFFTICMYKHCFLPLLLVFEMKYCVKMHCSLPHNPYCFMLPSPAHLHMYQLFTHCLPTIIYVMLMLIVFFIFTVFLCFLLCACVSFLLSLWLLCIPALFVVSCFCVLVLFWCRKLHTRVNNGQWFIVSYDSANKQEHCKKPLH